MILHLFLHLWFFFKKYRLLSISSATKCNALDKLYPVCSFTKMFSPMVGMSKPFMLPARLSSLLVFAAARKESRVLRETKRTMMFWGWDLLFSFELIGAIRCIPKESQYDGADKDKINKNVASGVVQSYRVQILSLMEFGGVWFCWLCVSPSSDCYCMQVNN